MYSFLKAFLVLMKSFAI